MRATFFARVKSVSVFDTVGFYRQDIEVLRSLGFDVLVTNRLRDLLQPTDLYYIWWWSSAAPAVWIARRRGVPSVITGTFNYSLPMGKGDYISRPGWHKALIRYALRNTTVNVYVSKSEYTEVPERISGGRSVFVPHGVDTAFFSPMGERDRTLVFNVAWSGRWNAIRKCLPELIASVPYVLQVEPTARFVLAGKPGEAYDGLVNLARDLGVEHAIQWLGVIDEERKRELMRTCGVYASPSLYEGFGLAIAEALSCGAPVVTSPVGAIPEVVGNSAVFVEGKDPKAIADGILRVMRDPELARKIGIEGREHVVAHFNMDVRARGIKKVVASLG